MRKYIIQTISLCFTLTTSAQEAVWPLVWYNTENIFDTINDPSTNDNEFLPDAQKEWVSWKYWTKLNRISKVIRNASGTIPPAVIALGEIENNRVLVDLSRRPALVNTGYRVIHYDSPDRRGIDVGILYDPERIDMISSRALPVRFSDAPNSRTRDILLATGILPNGDTLHILANHWPSRWGGREASEPKRMEAASTVKRAMDSLLAINANALIIVTGDFNDNPDNRSIVDGLGTGNYPPTLINLMEKMDQSQGSYRYRGEWSYLDQWMVSPSIINSASIQIDTAYVYAPQTLLEETTRYPGFQPKRSWQGPRFTGGYSDHLPIVLILSEKIK